MFIKKVKKKYPNTGRSYSVFQLFESVETPQGQQQRLLLSLGVKLNLPEAQHQLLADCIEAISTRTPSAPFPPEVEALAQVFAAQLENRQRSQQRRLSIAKRLEPRLAQAKPRSRNSTQDRKSFAPRRALKDFKGRSSFVSDDEQFSKAPASRLDKTDRDFKPRRFSKPRDEEFSEAPRSKFAPRQDKAPRDFKPRRSFKARDEEFSEAPRSRFAPHREKTSRDFKPRREEFAEAPPKASAARSDKGYRDFKPRSSFKPREEGESETVRRSFTPRKNSQSVFKKRTKK